MSMRIFVAGAAGAVGRQLCPLLIEEGWHITGTTRSVNKAPILQGMGVQPVIVDVYDVDALRAAVADAAPDVVIHQLTDLPPALDSDRMAAGLEATARIRVEGTRNLVSAAAAVGANRFIVQSICFFYAPGPMPYGEDAPLKEGGSGAAGATASAVAEMEAQVLDAPFDGVVLRYGRFYGPGTGFDAPPEGAPVHVDAAADAARRAVTRGGGIYNIAEDDGTVTIAKAVNELGWDPAFRVG